jgi:uncharacterized protein YdaU (DUF1376 family)
MMARPWYAFYPADYARDTGHLTLTEHGAYRALMDHYYSLRLPLQNDLPRLLHVCRATSKPERQAVTRILNEFFVLDDAGYRHARIDAELEKAAEVSAKCSFAAKAKHAKRAGNSASHSADADADRLPSQSQPQAQAQTDSGFAQFWKAYPRKEARGAARAAYSKACADAAPETLIAAAAEYARKREGQERRYTRTAATWLAQECWLDDAPAEAVEIDPALWDGAAVKLAAEIGAASFQSYFAHAQFSRGPPARLGVGKAHLRDLIARKYSGALTRLFGEFVLEVSP